MTKIITCMIGSEDLCNMGHEGLPAALAEYGLDPRQRISSLYDPQRSVMYYSQEHQAQGAIDYMPGNQTRLRKAEIEALGALRNKIDRTLTGEAKVHMKTRIDTCIEQLISDNKHRDKS